MADAEEELIKGDHCPVCGTTLNTTSGRALCAHVRRLPRGKSKSSDLWQWVVLQHPGKPPSAQDQKYSINWRWRR